MVFLILKVINCNYIVREVYTTGQMIVTGLLVLDKLYEKMTIMKFIKELKSLHINILGKKCNITYDKGPQYLRLIILQNE